MHDTAHEIGRLFFEIYGRPNQMIVELGSYNVNGALRDFCPNEAAYVGLDLDAGPGVNIIVQAGRPLPLNADFADLVVSSSAFEHDPFFWETFVELTRVLKPGGFLYLNAPSNGAYHRYPTDCWRFYPDCGGAFERLARKNGYPLTLIESFVAERRGDIWNDFVAVFAKTPNVDPHGLQFISTRIACTNVFRFGEQSILAEREATEDMTINQALRREIAQLKANRGRDGGLAGVEQSAAAFTARPQGANDVGASPLERLQALRAETGELRRTLEQMQNSLPPKRFANVLP